jgi:hypothetical protein
MYTIPHSDKSAANGEALFRIHAYIATFGTPDLLEKEMGGMKFLNHAYWSQDTYDATMKKNRLVGAAFHIYIDRNGTYQVGTSCQQVDPNTMHGLQPAKRSEIARAKRREKFGIRSGKNIVGRPPYHAIVTVETAAANNLKTLQDAKDFAENMQHEDVRAAMKKRHDAGQDAAVTTAQALATLNANASSIFELTMQNTGTGNHARFRLKKKTAPD